MATDAPDPTTFTLKDALDYAWKWFELHSSQRMQLVNYFLVAVAFLTAAYATGLQADRPAVSAVVAVLGAVVSWAFQQIEQRTRELIKLSEATLQEIENAMQADTTLSSVRLVARAEVPSRPRTSYFSVIRVLHWSTLGSFLLGLAYAVWISL